MQRQNHRLLILPVFVLLIIYLIVRWNYIIVQVLVQNAALRDPCSNIGSLQGDDPQLVACLKKQFLVAPTLLPYNLSNSKVEDPSEFGQQGFALKLHSFKRNGIFVECGGLDGEFLSNTLYLERRFGWTGLLIEAERNNYENLVRKRRKIWTSNSCLSPKTTSEKLTLVGIEYTNTSGGITLMKNSDQLKRIPGYVNSKRIPTQVQCFPLYTYFLALNITEVDYFSLDVEGADFEILKTIPFDKIIFKVLEVEVEWISEGKGAVKRFLEENGYIFVKEIGVDFIFVHKSFKIPHDI